MVTLILLGLLLLPVLLVAGGMALFLRGKRRSILIWAGVIYLALILVVFLGVAPYAAAWSIAHAGTRLQDRQLKDTPAQQNVFYEDITFEARDSLRLSGWLIPPRGKNAIVICTHGLFRNRIEVLPRTLSFAKAGYGALLYDSRSHGLSAKGSISLGYHERNDVLGAIQYVRRRFQDTVEEPRIVLMGVSMGAMATLEAAAETKDYDALILDSPFSSLQETIINHSWLWLKMPRYPLPSIFLFWFQRISGFDQDRVNAHRALARILPVPLLIIASKGDQRMGIEVPQLLFQESKASVKELKLFGEDVPHGSAARIHPDAYSTLALGFLERALAQPDRVGNDDASVTSTSGIAGSRR
jgi:pimeloyl-ACP methyl ester carboxylesterase